MVSLQPKSLFGMIRNTHERGGEERAVCVQRQCGSDSRVAMRGGFPNPETGVYGYEKDIHILMKVETHNHLLPFPLFPGLQLARQSKYAMKVPRGECQAKGQPYRVYRLQSSDTRL